MWFKNATLIKEIKQMANKYKSFQFIGCDILIIHDRFQVIVVNYSTSIEFLQEHWCFLNQCLDFTHSLLSIMVGYMIKS